MQSGHVMLLLYMVVKVQMEKVRMNGIEIATVDSSYHRPLKPIHAIPEENFNQSPFSLVLRQYDLLSPFIQPWMCKVRIKVKKENNDLYFSVVQCA